MSTLRGPVFLSYASEDSAAATRVAEALQKSGVEVWLDVNELKGGDVWDRRIRSQVLSCAIFIPIVSLATEARQEGYFRREWRLAVDRMNDMSESISFLVPVVIDSTDPRGADVPAAFKVVQWSTVPEGRASPEFVAHITRLLGLDRADLQPSASITDLPSKRAALVGTSRGRFVAIAATAVLLGLLVALIARFFSARDASPNEGVNAATTTVTADQKSIAVLPFVDLSEKKDQEYFADGMAEEVLDLLVRIPGLRVIGRTSSFQFKRSTEDLRTIGNKLGAAFVVEGSVRRSSGRVRVTAQLIESVDGTHRWSETYDRPDNDMLRVQDEIAAGLTRALQISLGADRPESRRSARSVEAYDMYLRGLYAMDRNDDDGYTAAVAYLQQAVKLDPTSAEAAVALAETYYWQANNSLVASRVGYPQARDAAEVALKLDGSLGLAHAILGAIHTEYDRDWPSAEREFARALELASRDGVVLWLAAQLPFALGHDDAARAMYKQSLAYDPLLATSYLNLSWVECRSGRLVEAEAAARKVLEIDPSFVWGHVFLGYALLLKGDTAGALTEMERETDPKGHIDGLALVYYALGRKSDADEALEKLTAEHSGHSAFYIAEAHAYRGEFDDALIWLDRAYAQKEPTLFLIKGDPFFSKLKDDARYRAFLYKIGVPE